MTLTDYRHPAEDPAMLEGPEVGTLCIYSNSRYPQWDGTVVRVVARSYVWSPGQPSACRHYDWSVIEVEPGKEIVVNDANLVPLAVGQKVQP